MNRSSLNHAPGVFVPTWKATRSPNRLMGSSRSFGPGEESGSGVSAVGYASLSMNAERFKFPAPSAYSVRYAKSFRCERTWYVCSRSWLRKKYVV